MSVAKKSFLTFAKSWQKRKTKAPTSFKETQYGILPRADIIKLESQAVKKGMNLLLSSNEKPITPEFIKEIHKYCFSNILENDGGKFRTVQVMYSGKEAPHFSKINELMINLCADTKCAIKNMPTKTITRTTTVIIRIFTIGELDFGVMGLTAGFTGATFSVATLFSIFPPIIFYVEQIDNRENAKGI